MIPTNYAVGVVDKAMMRSSHIRSLLVTEAAKPGAEQLHPSQVLGVNVKVDTLARRWNEEAFCLGHASPGPVTPLGHSGPVKKMGRWNSKERQMVTAMVRNEYGVARDKASPGRWLLMQRPVDADGPGDWGPVGEYAGGNLGIMAAYRREGAGRAFEEYLIKHGHRKGPSIGYSPEGLKTVLSAHKKIVADALAAMAPKVSALAVDKYELKPPAGYVRQGDYYVTGSSA